MSEAPMSEEPTTSPASHPPNSDGAEGSVPDAIEVTAEAVSDTIEAISVQAEPTPPPEAPRPANVRVAIEPSQSQQLLDQALKRSKEYWQKAQPILKQKSIQALRAANRFTNHFLDNVWPKITQQAIAAVPASAKAKIETQKTKLQPTLDKLQPIWDKGVVPFWQKVVVPLWMKGLAFLRQRLPENLAQELTDRFMTVAIITLMVVVYWFFSSLTAGQPAVAKQPTFPKPMATPLVKRPVSAPIAQTKPKTAPVIPTSPKPVALSPNPIPSIAPASRPTPAIAPQPSPTPAIDLAEIQTQLASSIASVGGTDGLIASVRSLEANQRLQVSLEDTWFDLTPSAQDQVAQTLWERSQQQFDRLELRGPTNALIARSPVVGSKVIVLQRQDPKNS